MPFRYDLTSLALNKIGQHEDAVRCMSFLSKANLLATGSWDSCIAAWDSRSPKPAFHYNTGSKIYAMDSQANFLVVGGAKRVICIFDIRKLGAPLQKRESSLRYQTRSVVCFPDGEGSKH